MNGKLIFALVGLVLCFHFCVGRSESIQEKLEEHNKFFQSRKEVSTPPKEKTLGLIGGQGRVLITAPHAVDHIRGERTKGADFCTGPIAMVLGELTGAPVMFLQYKSLDPNYYDDGVEMKVAVASYLRSHPEVELVIDIHAASAKRPFDIDLGTMHGRSLDSTKVEFMKEVFQEHGLLEISENFFPGVKQATMVKFISGLEISAVQVEIHKSWRCEDPHRSEALLQALAEIVRQYQ